MLLFENILAREALGQTADIDQLDSGMKRVLCFVRTIRERAAMRAGNEPYSRYFAGLGLVCLACLGLPDIEGDEPLSRLMRSWYAVAAAIQLHIASESADQCTLWPTNLRSESDDYKLSLYVNEVALRLQAGVFKAADSLWKQAHVAGQGLIGYASKLGEMKLLSDMLPRTMASLSNIAAEHTRGLDCVEGERLVLNELIVAMLLEQLDKETILSAAAKPHMLGLKRSLIYVRRRVHGN